MYGIPEFRLPKAIVQKEVDKLRAMGVDIETNMVIGKVLSVDELFGMGYEAVFVGSGAGLPSFLGIPGETHLGVLSANEFLTRINLMKGYRPGYDTPVPKAEAVAVVGGGNVAMDAARCAAAWARRRSTSSTAGARRRCPPPGRNPSRQGGGGGVPLPHRPRGGSRGRQGVCHRSEMHPHGAGRADASGRRRPVEIPGSEFVLPVQLVIPAIGNTPNPLIRTTTPGP